MSKDSKREILGVSPLSYKFQITVPKKVREKIDAGGGDSIAFIEEAGRVYITKSTKI